MEENETVHPDYQKGFNEGYDLAKLAPEIAATIRNLQFPSLRIEGIKAGITEFSREHEKTNLPDWLKLDKYLDPRKNDKSLKDLDKNDFEKE